MRTVVVIPALNEERALPHVLADLPREEIEAVVVVDNGSTDATAERAREGGAHVVEEPRRGYGQACLTGIAAARDFEPDVLAFLDADYSDHPDELPRLLRPIREGRADFVVGSRIRGESETGALLPQARYGNAFACALMRWRWNAPFTDLGPFRAIRFEALEALGMKDRDYGWTVEMQVKALRKGLRCVEVPVSYRRGLSRSQITGTLAGTIRASMRILEVLFRHLLAR